MKNATKYLIASSLSSVVVFVQKSMFFWSSQKVGKLINIGLQNSAVVEEVHCSKHHCTAKRKQYEGCSDH